MVAARPDNVRRRADPTKDTGTALVPGLDVASREPQESLAQPIESGWPSQAR